MSIITVQCRLIAPKTTRQTLWNLMAQKNTPLVNELLTRVAEHSDFDTWLEQGRLKAATVKQLCQPLKNDPRFIGQPGRFYTSAGAQALLQAVRIGRIYL